MTRRYGDLILVAQQSGTSHPRCFCDLYFDAAAERWILDRVFD